KDSGPGTANETPWLPDEVQVLVTLWAQPNIQKQLLTAASDQVFTYLSSELSLVGFNKTPRQCSVKVNELKEEYKKIKHMEPYGVVKGDWFAILDIRDSQRASLQTSHQSLPDTAEGKMSSCLFTLQWQLQ
uniref:Myb/SANT-like DNA-binding domain-containing protein n=1 Tax=Haplochromis burtoni TaxID=8153 RepID=A0A3Q2W0J3_HAPBU